MPGSAARRGRVKARLIRAAKLVGVVLAAYYVLAVVLLVVYRFVNPPITGLQLQRRIESVFASGPYRPKDTPVALRTLPRHVPRAIVAAEDGRFYTHHGFDLIEMRRAGEQALEGRRARGASTITQQLMKNLFGCTCRNPVRKLYDFALTPPAELILGKQRILELYLNEVEWGRGVYGIEEAARLHYGTRARSLSATQAAGLAALLPNPRRRTPANTGQYRAEILRRMRVRGWL
jgi:monofunctional biosynthetic peptidoglycan transglycosylase